MKGIVIRRLEFARVLIRYTLYLGLQIHGLLLSLTSPGGYEQSGLNQNVTNLAIDIAATMHAQTGYCIYTTKGRHNATLRAMTVQVTIDFATAKTYSRSGVLNFHWSVDQ